VSSAWIRGLTISENLCEYGKWWVTQSKRVGYELTCVTKPSMFNLTSERLQLPTVLFVKV